jgi:AmmeMemoRadiSam system protein B
MRRTPAVAGRFYPDDPDELSRLVSQLVGDVRHAKKQIGIVVPHAGYVYSGGVAGKVFAETVVPRRVIVLAPNHTGRGARMAVWNRGSLAVPGGELPVDEALCAALLDADVGFVADREAHRYEHALEVELPFLRAREKDVMVTPVILGGLDGDECIAVGETLAQVVGETSDHVLVVASSDMSHYLADEVARKVDRRAIEAMLALDARGLYDVVEREAISMCGVLPATAMLSYARARGAEAASLVAYATSADAFGDKSRVVGYAGIAVN